MSNDRVQTTETVLTTILFIVMMLPVVAFFWAALAPAPVEHDDYVSCQVHAASQADVGRCIELHQE